MKTVKRTGIALAIALTFPLALPAATAAQPSLTNSKAATMTEKHGQFIAVGKVVQVTFGDFAFKLDFTDDKTMTFTGIGEASQGIPIRCSTPQWRFGRRFTWFIGTNRSPATT
ncbi:hypothetical protein [Serratia montpellierensis]|uniref:hypothetical protein n=1 Tax=Serratia montpellierensis TaxID=2598730 RepID=UPI001E4059E2|nr:hypothetical protein [Serratia sp. Lou2A]